MNAYNHITKIDGTHFTAVTVSGRISLPCFKTIEELETHSRDWQLLKARTHAPRQNYNQEVTQVVAYKLWRAHLEQKTSA